MGKKLHGGSRIPSWWMHGSSQCLRVSTNVVTRHLVIKRTLEFLLCQELKWAFKPRKKEVHLKLPLLLFFLKKIVDAFSSNFSTVLLQKALATPILLQVFQWFSLVIVSLLNRIQKFLLQPRGHTQSDGKNAYDKGGACTTNGRKVVKQIEIEG